MPTFARSFRTDILAEWERDHPGTAVRALFDRWCFPGEPTTDRAMLRLGLRDGYLNFYRNGQSVAKLSCGSGGPRLSVHNAYVTRRGRKPHWLPVKGNRSYDAAELADPATAVLIPGWIDTAATYATAEKCFVDELIGANAGVIDLEMGLPASDLPGGERVAPRMDLVVAQRRGNEPPSIAFWEAKCASNSELRARGDQAPRVIDQIERYVAWIRDGDRVDEVRHAYRAAAGTLLTLYRLFGGNGPAPRCAAYWEALAATEVRAVAARPAIVIGNEWPTGYTPAVIRDRMAQAARSFARDGHRAKLERARIPVHEVGSAYQRPELPFVEGELSV